MACISLMIRVFQSTLPVWGATDHAIVQHLPDTISIHAPRVGSDRFFCLDHSVDPDFNPRSPCGERHDDPDLIRRTIYFNPRSPCGERPLFGAWLPGEYQFQSTLPVWGATLTGFLAIFMLLDFNPRSPCGERLRRSKTHGRPFDFNPRSPCGERPSHVSVQFDLEDFNPRSPCGERQPPSPTTCIS